MEAGAGSISHEARMLVRSWPSGDVLLGAAILGALAPAVSGAQDVRQPGMEVRSAVNTRVHAVKHLRVVEVAPWRGDVRLSIEVASNVPCTLQAVRAEDASGLVVVAMRGRAVSVLPGGISVAVLAPGFRTLEVEVRGRTASGGLPVRLDLLPVAADGPGANDGQ